ncbi:DNA polymerase III subunit alpha [candidate division KSB1 bacterium]|nr:DNA polymerase III subunit alpha [candidate division KSB1 bacterium]
MERFVHLHVHSNFSMCRGANTLEDICSTAQKMGKTFVSLTDTNGVYGLVWYIELATRYGLKPIIGAYLTAGQNFCVILAKNLSGYRFLCRIITKIHTDETFDFAQYLFKFRHDVIVLSSDLDLLHQFIRQSDRTDFYAELVPHSNREAVLLFARKHNIPVVASNAVYFLRPDEFRIHRLLRAIDLNTSFDRIAQEELVSSHSWFKSDDEMQNSFPDCPEAIENSIKIARQCVFKLNFNEFIFASVKGPNGESAQQILEQKVREGLYKRYGKVPQAAYKRMAYELEIINEKNFAPYFLVVADVVAQAPRTCGRGSAAASLVSYCLGITHVDPVKYNLFFERFLNKNRQDPPDIDVDFPWDERDDVLGYIFEKYGRENAAMISNHNSFKGRSAVREIAKVYGIPDSEISAITKKMSGYWQPDNLWNLTKTHPIYKNVELLDPWPEIFSLAEKIRGFPRHLSVHCGGVVIAPGGLDQYVPHQPAKKVLKPAGVISNGSSGLPFGKKKQLPIHVVQWEKDQAEDMGLIKMDILGNRSLAVIRDALLAIKVNYGVEIDYAQWNPLYDADTQKLLARGQTIGVFYVESPAMRQLQKKTGKGDFEHLVIHSSIIRPAANRYINEYIRRLKGGSYRQLHPLMEDILRETFGIMVYQEDVSKVVIALAGFDPAEADDLRKVISKKHKQHQVLDYRQKFFKGAQARGVSFDGCEKIWDMIMSFSGYSFCKPHSASFALVSFKSAWLRAHYPAEFMAAVISNRGGYYSTFAYISEARRMGLTVLPPDINESEIHFTGKDRKIRVGFSQLMGISQKSVDHLISVRKKQGVFRTFDHFLSAVTIDPSDVVIFIKSGCFDALEKQRTRPELLWRLKLKYSKKTAQDTASLFDESCPVKVPRAQQYNRTTMLKHEVETLGFIFSQHPLSLYMEKLNFRDFIKAKDLSVYKGKHVKMAGWLITGKTVSTKNDELMEFISFEDTTAIYEATFFPKAYRKFVHMLSHSRPYRLEGTVDSHFGACSLTVEKADFL